MLLQHLSLSKENITYTVDQLDFALVHGVGGSYIAISCCSLFLFYSLFCSLVLCIAELKQHYFLRSYIIFWKFAKCIWSSIKSPATYPRYSLEGFCCAAFGLRFFFSVFLVWKATFPMFKHNIYRYIYFSLGFHIIASITWLSKKDISGCPVDNFSFNCAGIIL